MDAAQATHEKRTINVKQFLDDFQSGLTDLNLMQKYNLTENGLATFYKLLDERGILKLEETLRNHSAPQPSHEDSFEFPDEKSSYICPRCLASHEIMFDICPSCGVSFHELISQDSSLTGSDQSKDGTLQKQEKSAMMAEQKEFSELRASFDSDSGKDLSGNSVTDIVENDDIPKFERFETSLEQIVSAQPFDSVDEPDDSPGVRCDSCDRPTEAGIKNIYDRKRALKTGITAAICFVCGFMGIIGLSLFQAQSFSRLIIFFCTVATILAGVSLATVTAFLFLAQEKVYICRICNRSYPRI